MEAVGRSYIPLRKVDWRFVLPGFAVVLICLFFYRQLDFVANGEPRPALLTFSEEAIGCLSGLIVFPLVYLAAIRFPLPSPNWRSNVLAHVAAVSLISIVHTSLIALLRALILPLIGFGHASYGYLPIRYPMEFAHLFIFYWVGVSLIYLFHEIRFAREREIRQAKLETSLAEAQLQTLRLQLEPHFLFNALNAISAAIYENPRMADEMIGRLGDLLRQLLRSDRSQEIPLTREIELLQLYTRIMEARLEKRLSVEVEMDEAAADALVPQLIFQPLVENAIRHGMSPVTFQANVCIRARRAGNTLELSVRDRGPGIETIEPLRFGIGLRNTSERLEKLYGPRHRFEIRNAEGGGAIVEIRLPFRPASSAPASMARAMTEHVVK